MDITSDRELCCPVLEEIHLHSVHVDSPSLLLQVAMDRTRRDVTQHRLRVLSVRSEQPSPTLASVAEIDSSSQIAKTLSIEHCEWDWDFSVFSRHNTS
jgi:hypothetical protein